mgnify:FL=1
MIKLSILTEHFQNGLRKDFILVTVILASILMPFLGCTQNEIINQTDDQSKKQGYWIFTNKEKHLPGYQPDQKVEEEKYIDNKKEGKWIFYFNNKKPKHILVYKNNIPNGKAIFYYKNGNIREKGVWKNNRWIGEYLMYYRNGNLKNQFTYSNQGIKDGPQKYFYENGNLMISGTWSNGYETEDIHEYNEDGTPNTKRFDPGPSIIKEDSLESIENNAIDSIVVKANKKLTPPKIIPTFDGNGFHEFKDRYGNNSKVGEFENGLLVNGKIFKYNQKGKLIQTKHVKNGKIVLVENNKEVEE